MCGLFISIGIKPDPSRLDRVAHRGPDGAGWEVIDTGAGPLALGHRRLSIIDLDDRALQPMTSQDGQCVILLNGEIYNYKELQAELLQLGHSFTTTSDTEVLMAAWRQWGEACLMRLRGMFACMIYDKAAQTFAVARDPFGIKPLYYIQTLEGLAFASEIKQIYDIDGVSRRLNKQRAWDFLVSQTTDHTSETMFEGVRQIRPGFMLKLDLSKPLPAEPVAPLRWFDIPRLNTVNLDEADAAAEFKTIFERSVQMHLRADVPVGSCLSGGLDSSSIVGVASRQLPDPKQFRTYSVVFPGTKVDETPFVTAVNAFNHSQAHLIELDPARLPDVARRVIWQQDEPFGSTTILAQWFVFESIGKDKTKVVLDGQGADEQLAGYHGIFDFYQSTLVKRGRFLDLANSAIQRKIYHKAPMFTPFWRMLSRKLARFLPPPPPTVDAMGWLRGGWLEKCAPVEGSTMSAVIKRDNLPSLDTIGELCLALSVGTNLAMLLRYEDRNSMAHGVEARVPFVDVEVMAFTLGLGEKHKMVGGDTKRVLRRAMRDYLPPEVLYRRDKLGFSTPEANWMSGPLREFTREGVAKCLQRFPGMLNAEQVARMETALDTTQKADAVLWRIANIGHWAEMYGVAGAA